MKTLVVEDDFASRLLMQGMLEQFGPLHVAVNGREGVGAVRTAMDQGEPYDLVCLDIMMPDMDGHEALKEIRKIEEARGILNPNGVKIFMTTASGDFRNVSEAFRGLCDAYMVKPIEKAKMLDQVRRAGLIA